ncbi:MAG: MarR family transcriptional regulator [Bacteriovorax sp.]|nr:MarR family transcriptional regulator [Bacteriovorax sp.]
MSEPNEIAKKLLEIIPPSMNWIRTEMRSTMNEELTVPQFRILASIFRGNNVACDIAKTQGTSQAAMSKMIDGLVAKGFVKREANVDDRRHFHLMLTSIGDAYFKKTRKHAQANLKEQISCLDERDRDDLTRGLIALEKLFLSAREKDSRITK